MNYINKQQSLEEKLITSAPFSMSNEQNFINSELENSIMKQEEKTTHKPSKKRSWLLGLGIAALGLFSTHNSNAQGMFDNTTQGAKELVASAAHRAAFGNPNGNTKTTARYIDYSKYEEKLPGAISSSSDNAFKKYWISQEEKMSSFEINKNLENISSETKNNNPYFFLAKIKNGGTIEKSEKHKIGLTNPGLREHIVGTEFYYQKDWKQARLHYAMGMFKSAQIDKSDLEYLNIQSNLSPIQLYKTIADKFIEANYEKKEEIIQKVILDDNNKSDKLKMVYDNLGGFIISNYCCKHKEESLKLRNKENSNYQIIKKKIDVDFNSASNSIY